MNLVKKFIQENSYILYPLLFSLFPLISFYGSNKAEIQSGDFSVWTFILFNLLVGAGCWVFSLALFRDKKKASLFSLGLMLVFFNLGRLIRSFGTFSIKLPFLVLGPTKLTLGISLLFLAGLFLAVRKINKDSIMDTFGRGLVLVSLSMLVIAGLPILTQGSPGLKKNTSSQEQITGNISSPVAAKPDVYYILLDGYARADFLKENFNFDNSTFINELKNRGFYVAEKANSNYAHTHLSVPSTFNMKYLNYLADEEGEESNNRRPLRDLTVDNEMIKIFQSLGYSYIQNGTQWGWTEKNPHTDITIQNDGKDEKKILGIPLDEFAQVYLQTTALKPWVASSIRDGLVDITLGAYEKTEKVPEYKVPTFTFTHIVSPHPPYLFDENGIIPGLTKLELDNHGFSDRGKFADQTAFVNKRLLAVIDNILLKSESKPLIVIASDHGPASGLKLSDFKETDPAKFNQDGIKERMGILNAYFFPDSNYEKLYQNITPVNTFRLILSQYFGQKLELLEDRSFFSDNKDNQYRMFDVTKLVTDD